MTSTEVAEVHVAHVQAGTHVAVGTLLTVGAVPAAEVPDFFFQLFFQVFWNELFTQASF